MLDIFSCQDGDKLIRLWIHEVYRVFYDRLIDNEDKETFFGIVKQRTSDFFKQNVEKVHVWFFNSVILYIISQILNKCGRISLWIEEGQNCLMGCCCYKSKDFQSATY